MDTASMAWSAIWKACPPFDALVWERKGGRGARQLVQTPQPPQRVPQPLLRAATSPLLWPPHRFPGISSPESQTDRRSDMALKIGICPQGPCGHLQDCLLLQQEAESVRRPR